MGALFPHQTGRYLRARLRLHHQKGAPESEGCRGQGMKRCAGGQTGGARDLVRTLFSDMGELGVSLGSVSLYPSGL